MNLEAKKEIIVDNLLNNVNYYMLAPCNNCIGENRQCSELKNMSCMQVVEWMKLIKEIKDLQVVCEKQRQEEIEQAIEAYALRKASY